MEDFPFEQQKDNNPKPQDLKFDRKFLEDKNTFVGTGMMVGV